MHNRPPSSLPHTDARAPTTRRRAARWWTAALAFGLAALVPMALAGPDKIFGNHYAWVNNFNDPNNIIQGTFGTGSTPELTVTFNFADYNLYGYPPIVRGWHYDWNPTSDTLFPKQISSISALPFKFNYSAGGTNLAGDFAYDIFFSIANLCAAHCAHDNEVARCASPVAWHRTSDEATVTGLHG